MTNEPNSDTIHLTVVFSVIYFFPHDMVEIFLTLFFRHTNLNKNFFVSTAWKENDNNIGKVEGGETQQNCGTGIKSSIPEKQLLQHK